MLRKLVVVVVAFAAIAVAGNLIAQDKGPRRGSGKGRPPTMGQGQSDAPFYTAEPIGKDDFEKNALKVLDEMDKNQRRGNMLVPREDGRLLRQLVEMSNAQLVIEVGTSIGYSGVWQALGLKRTDGKMITYEIDEKRAAAAKKNFKAAGVDDIITLVLGDAHKEVGKIKGTIDIIFLDADKDGYLDYLEQLLPKLRPGGIIVGHNINPRQADPKYLERIKSDPELETVLVNARGSGVSITMKKR